MTRSIEDGQSRETPSVVGIGASAGGISALQDFFSALPSDTGMSFAVILHLDPNRESQLAEILQSKTEMPVSQVQGTVPLEANHVYVIPPNKQLEVTEQELLLSDFEEPRGQRVPIDHFFRSLAESPGDGAAIVLSGTGSDGAVGIKDVKEQGGLILVQDPEEAEYESMPMSAIDTGLVDQVLPVTEMATRLPELKQLSTELPSNPDDLSDQQEQTLQQILVCLQKQVGHNFSEYKRTTVLRRLKRRMQINRVEQIDDYLTILKDHEEEAEALFKEVLVGVTSFFRDSEPFRVLEERIIPKLFDGKGADDSVRVWITGCSTGEEAYSVAMLLQEHAETLPHSPEIQLFASDLDENGLATARQGRYPRSIEADVSKERLGRFFRKEGSHYRVKRSLRDHIVFAAHSVLRDPPFSRIDLVTCRNVLIYLQRVAQGQVFKLFHYALRPGGYLFLGQAETAERSDLFRSVDSEHGFYQALERTGEMPEIPSLSTPDERFSERTPSSREFSDIESSGREFSERETSGEPLSLPAGMEPGKESSEEVLHRKALEASAPPSVLVDRQYNTVHLSDRAGRYMEPPKGTPTTDVTQLVRSELQAELRPALYKAFEERRATVARPVEVQFNGHPRVVYLTVRPVESEDGEPLALVLFNEGGRSPDLSTDVSAEEVGKEEDRSEKEESETAQQLREELMQAQKRLRETREKYESYREELVAQNEELRSMNEEYKAATEELETSKEELQSVNEELETVNRELEVKLEEVSRANSDLKNLMAATDVGTLFLDQELRIKRFTPQIEDYLSVRESDKGRPIGELAHRLDYNRLEADAQEVLESHQPVEREVSGGDDEWYLVRLRPYRTVEGNIEGVVAAFVDVTDLKQTEEELRAAKEYAELIINTVREGLLVLDEELRVQSASESFYEKFPIRPEDTEGRHLFEVGGGQWDVPELRALLKKVLPDGRAVEGQGFEDLEVTASFDEIGERTMLLNARRLEGRQEILLAIEDITERRAALRELEERTQQVRELTSQLSMAEHRERRRIAQILHDNLQQRLYGIQLKMSFLREEMHRVGSQKDWADHIKELEERLDTAIQSIRELSVSMSPPVLKSEGLAASLEWLQSQMRERHGLTVELSVDHEFQMENEDMRVLLFRIARELLFNVVKHAGVDRAEVELREEEGDLVIRVADEGRGFDPDTLEEKGPEEAFGLAAARGRVRPFGGEVEIDAAPGVGTQVTLRMPMSAVGAETD